MNDYEYGTFDLLFFAFLGFMVGVGLTVSLITW